MTAPAHRQTAPAHPSATGIGRLSGLVFLFLPLPDFETATEWSGLDVLGRIKLGSEGVPGEEGSLTFRLTNYIMKRLNDGANGMDQQIKQRT